MTGEGLGRMLPLGGPLPREAPMIAYTVRCDFSDAAVATDQPETGGLLLQGSEQPVIFRNIWIRQP